MKREMKKNLSFVLFVMAVFFAGMSLTVFQSETLMVWIAGAVLLVTTVFYAVSREKDESVPADKTSEILLTDRIAELMRGNEKAEKGVYIAVKKQHEAMESGLSALEERIAELIKVQESAVKTLVMYNKENAKQMALSEREELGRLCEEIKQLQQGGGSGESVSGVAEAIREMSARLYEEIHENSEAILSELGTTVDCLAEMKEFMDGLTDGGTIRVVVPEGEEERMETVEEEAIDVPEPIVIPEPVVVPEPIVIPEPVEEPKKETPEDALASSGVDLSDPNRALSPDDIAALIAAMGN